MQSREMCLSQLYYSIREAFRSVFGKELNFKVLAEVVAVVSAVSSII